MGQINLTLAVIFAAIAFARELPAVSADIVTGLRRLCVEGDPDAAAVLDTPNGTALLLFKERDFWVTDFDDIILAILNPHKRRNTTFSQDNAIEVSRVFANFPYGRKRIVSFTKLNASHPLQNNILVFHEDQKMTRYKVTHIDNLTARHNSTTRSDLGENGDRPEPDELAIARAQTPRSQRAKITATLEGQHTTNYWPFFPHNLDEILIMHNVQNTRLLALVDRITMDKTLWVLNQKNLDKPVGILTGHRLKKVSPYPNIDSNLFVHRFSNNRTGWRTVHLSILRGGWLCFELTCVPLRQFIQCDSSTLLFTSGLAYFIQYQTDMTLRLFMGALISALVISLSISITFVYNQLKKLAELT